MDNKIKKYKAYHDLITSGDVSDEIRQNLYNQFNLDSNDNEIKRFLKGFEAEDIFRFVFSVFPWVKLLIKLSEEQLPLDSKEHYQVPDYLLYFEDNKLVDNPVLIEVKSVNSDKMKLKLMGKQVNSLLNFSACMGIPLLFAVYWKKYRAWNINSIDHFQKRGSKYFLSMSDSLKYDLSLFLSHFTHIIPKNIFLRTTYSNSKNSEDSSFHKKYGYVNSEEVSLDGKNYISLEKIEAIMLKSFLNFTMVKEETNINTVVIKKNESQFIARLSYVIINFIFRNELQIDYRNVNAAVHIFISIVKKLNFSRLDLVPALRSITSDEIFKTSFQDSEIYDMYLRRPHIKDISN